MSDVDIYANLHLGIDGLRKEMAAARLARTAQIPRDRACAASGVYPSTGVLALCLGGPDQGWRWLVRRIAVGSLTPVTSTAGRADVFITGAPAPVAPITGGLGSTSVTGTAIMAGLTADWRDQATTLPLTAGYTSRQLVVSDTEQLWVVFSSGTSTQVYIANTGVEEYEESAARQDFVL